MDCFHHSSLSVGMGEKSEAKIAVSFSANNEAKILSGLAYLYLKICPQIRSEHAFARVRGSQISAKRQRRSGGSHPENACDLIIPNGRYTMLKHTV
jgi:hypothetical protein